MEPFDKRLKERAKQEPFPLPETYAGKVRNTCAALKETTMKDTKQKRSCRALLGVAVLVTYSPQNGLILLVIAFLISPFGLPKLAFWLLGQVQGLKYAIQDLIYG